MSVQFSSISENESFARVTVAAFIAGLDPTLDELTEIKTVVSEAVTNSIIHGYHGDPNNWIQMHCRIEHSELTLTIEDQGEGIFNVEAAKEPLYTSKPELERSGMGFTIIENFMDSVEVFSEIHQGTTIVTKKQFIHSKTVCN